MNTKELIEKHEKAISILDRIEVLKLRIKCDKESSEGYPGQFPKIKSDLEKKIALNEKAIESLTGRYEKLFG
jgi:hypothetical protein